MGEKTAVKVRTSICMAMLLAMTVLLPVLAGGCGASNPEAAVRDYYEAISNNDWDAYLNSILPDNVRRMTSSDLQTSKQSFKESEIEYSDMKFKTIKDKKDPNKAEVQMTAGKISFRNPNTGEKTSMTVAEIKKTYNVNTATDTAKYKGAWYVDVPMASADMETQQY